MRRAVACLALCWSLTPTATALAQGDACGRPVAIVSAPAPAAARVRDYAAIFQHCVNDAGARRLAIRRMSVDGEALLLAVDPQSLQTSLERPACWRCADTTGDAQKDTRYQRALRPPPDLDRPRVLANAGLLHGAGDGAFVTGDLCPSRKPLDKAFFDLLASQGPHTPVALAVSGLWIVQHRADFAWLREKARAGALDVTWVNHSYKHPYVVGLKEAQNYLMRPGVDLDREILDTERLLIAHGETPSVFFRFPGLVANGALLENLRARHLVALGADAWLTLSPPLRPGAIVLVHPNGNEPGGLALFSRLLANGRMPRPFRPINAAP